MKKIISTIDFSPAAENAALYAANLSEHYGADLLLYHTYLLPVSATEYGYPFVTKPELQEAAEFELNELAKKLQGALKKSIKISIKAEVNTFVEGLDELCNEEKPDLVVIGLTGKDALTRLVVGSHTIKTIHHIKYPVLVIPRSATFSHIMKIGFACDYKHVTETTPVALIKNIVQTFNAQLHVLNVDWKNREFTADTPDEHFYLRTFLDDLKAVYYNLEHESVTDAINEFAHKHDLDFIITIPKKHNLIEKLFGRSTTKELIYHTDVPVLCIHE